jgi:hypothetical protein
MNGETYFEDEHGVPMVKKEELSTGRTWFDEAEKGLTTYKYKPNKYFTDP